VVIVMGVLLWEVLNAGGGDRSAAAPKVTSVSVSPPPPPPPAKPCEIGGSCGYANVTAGHAQALASAQWTVPLGPCHNDARAGNTNHYGGTMTSDESDWSCVLKDREGGYLLVFLSPDKTTCGVNGLDKWGFGATGTSRLPPGGRCAG
jgi:hypothetical protein